MPHSRPFRAYTGGFALLLLAFSATTGIAAPIEGLRIFYAEAPAIHAHSIHTAAGQQKASALSTLSFQAYGRQFDLELHDNGQLLDGLPLLKQSELTQYVLYRGKLAGLTGSWVRLLRSADELRGVIWDGFDLYTIQPARIVAPFLVDPITADGGAAVIYRLSDTQADIGFDFCGSVASSDAIATPLQKFAALGAELQATPIAAATDAGKRIEIAAIADFAFYQRNGDDTEAQLLARMNIVDGIFSEQVGVGISVREIRIFTEASESLTSQDPGALLEQLGDLRRYTPELRNTGLAHLVTGRNLEGTTVGIAYVGSLCNARNSVSLSEGRHDLTYSALIATHEIGHNFGAPHDAEEGSVCKDTAPTFLMAKNLNGSHSFSQCSLDQIRPRVAAASCISVTQAVDDPGETGAGGGSTTSTPASGGGGGSLDWLAVCLLLGFAAAQRRRPPVRINRSVLSNTLSIGIGKPSAKPCA